MLKKNHKKSAVNLKQLIYAPIFIVFLLALTISVASFYISKNILLEQTKSSAISLLQHTTLHVEKNGEALKIINDLLEDKIRNIVTLLSDTDKDINNEFLINLKTKYNVDQIHWYNPAGEIIYSTNKSSLGTFPEKNTHIYEFIHNNKKETLEKVHPIDSSKNQYKYGVIKTIDGHIIQIGILAQNLYNLNEKLGYQSLVNELTKDNNIKYMSIVNKYYEVVADSCKTLVDSPCSSFSVDHIIHALNGEINTKELTTPSTQNHILQLSAPLFHKKQIIGAVIMGISMDHVYNSIFTLFITSFIISFFMFALFLWVLNKNILEPANYLNDNITKINPEKNCFYRMPSIVDDPFLGLTNSINILLDGIEDSFKKRALSQKELEDSNIELLAAYEQLTASEEELRTQYDEIQKYASELEKLQQKYEIAINGTNSAVWEVNLKDKTIYLSENFKSLSGLDCTTHQPLYHILNTLLNEHEKSKILTSYYNYKNGITDHIHAHITIKDAHGQNRSFLIKGDGIYDNDNSLTHVNGILLDITKYKKQEEYIEHVAYNDPLTNLPNRRSFLKKLENSLDSKKCGAVIMLDLDNFKSINDTLGHIYGDKVLTNIAKELVSIKDENIFISRFGGDEFLLLIENEKDKSKIEKFLKKIVNIFNNKQLINDDEMFISCSAGVSMYPQDSNEINQLLMNSDMAMYEVKNSGKNNYMFFNEDMTNKLKEETRIEKKLRKSIKENNLKLLYQPQVCTNTGKTIGFEALVRIKDENISPGLFIPVAEKTGLIVDLGRWVTKEAIKQVSSWQNSGFKLKPVAINFSAVQLNDSGYVDYLKNLIRDYGINPTYIEIEITESVFLNSKDKTIKFLNKIKSMGIKIALDDFGTGYSSLSYLTFLPVDKIKLDRSLCSKFLELSNIEVMNNLISLAHSLNLEVLAEGIEDMNQYESLKKLNCDYIQGYLFSKPLTSSNLEKVFNHNYLT